VRIGVSKQKAKSIGGSSRREHRERLPSRLHSFSNSIPHASPARLTARILRKHDSPLPSQSLFFFSLPKMELFSASWYIAVLVAGLVTGLVGKWIHREINRDE
jgi:hypothetical protein